MRLIKEHIKHELFICSNEIFAEKLQLSKSSGNAIGKRGYHFKKMASDNPQRFPFHFKLHNEININQ